MVRGGWMLSLLRVGGGIRLSRYNVSSKLARWECVQTKVNTLQTTKSLTWGDRPVGAPTVEPDRPRFEEVWGEGFERAWPATAPFPPWGASGG